MEDGVASGAPCLKTRTDDVLREESDGIHVLLSFQKDIQTGRRKSNLIAV